MSLRDGFTLTTPSGRLLARILASVAEFENEVRKERQAAGIAAAKARGKKWGGRKRGTTLLDYGKINDYLQCGFSATETALLCGCSKTAVYDFIKRGCMNTVEADAS